MYSSPGTPTGDRPHQRSSTYTWLFPIGLPSSTGPPPISPSLTLPFVTPTVASVGPYSFTASTHGATSRSFPNASPCSSSPPISSTWGHSSPASAGRLSLSSRRCAGVSFRKRTLPPSTRSVSHSSTSVPRSISTTSPPSHSGTSSSVSVKSKLRLECTSPTPRLPPRYSLPPQPT